MEETRKSRQRVMSKKIATAQSASYREAWKNLDAAKKAVVEAEKAVVSEVRNLGDYHKISPLVVDGQIDVVRFDYYNATLEFIVMDVEIQKPEPKAESKKPAEPPKPAPFRVPLNIEEKTVRMLLNGDMLSEAQKKKLVGGMIPGLLDEGSEGK